MFPFRKGELSFRTSDIKNESHEDNNVVDTPKVLEDHALARVGSINIGSNDRRRGRGRGRKASVATSSNTTDDDNWKRLMHRELERQRRQEMSNLYSSLQSVLPAEYSKGKRSMSEHVAGAINYITELEKNVKELEGKRDELKKSDECSISERGDSSTWMPDNNVLIRKLPGGLQIEINVAFEDDKFSLAAAIKVVQEEGISVVSCGSSRIHDRVIHNVICEVSDDDDCINVSELYQRLIHLLG